MGAASTQPRTTDVTIAPERLDALSQLPGDVVALVDGDGVVLAVSPSTERTLGYPPERYLGRQSLDIVHPDDRGTARALWCRLRDDPAFVARAELRTRHADGAWRWVEVIGRNLLDDEAVRAIVVNYRDVTERKAVEHALRASEERFRALVQHSSDLVIILDENGTITYSNPSVNIPMTDGRHPLLGLRAIDLVHPDDRQPTAESL